MHPKVVDKFLVLHFLGEDFKISGLYQLTHY